VARSLESPTDFDAPFGELAQGLASQEERADLKRVSRLNEPKVPERFGRAQGMDWLSSPVWMRR
jgi:hypothetical protein